MDGETALRRLIQGNERFVKGRLARPRQQDHWRRRLTSGQNPFAVILGCSDSRVPPELVFDQGFGDLFVVRVAGHVVTPDVLGSIQYAGGYLGTRLIVVLGHEGCGAVKAALAQRNGEPPQPGKIQSLMRRIQPALAQLPPGGDPARTRAAVEANVRHAVRQLEESPEARRPLREGRLKIVGAVYELETGRARFLPDF